MAKRKTNEQFQHEVYALVGNEYTFLDPYVNAHTKLRVKHNKCGNIYEVKPNDFLNNRRCPYCSKKKTDARFKKDVFSLVGNEYKFLDPYVDSKTKIRVKHNKCNNIYDVKPNAFFNGSRCPYCSNNHKKTDAQFKQEVRDLVGNDYVFLDAYAGNKSKLRVKHNKCGNIYEVQPSNFLRGTRCPYCNGKAKKTDTDFKREVYDLVGNDYTLLDSYVDAFTKLRIKHNKCGHVYKVAPHEFIKGCRCPYCATNSRKTDAQFKKEVFDLVGDEYTVLGSYINTNTKIKIKHNKCNTVYKVRPHTFLEGYRCPYCNSPKGETIISKILDTINIKYIPQKTFPDLKDKSYLSYDFYIPDQNILIEYQGLQHYEPVEYFGGEDKFKLQQKHDKLKSEYAKKHGYNLIAIPYTYDTFSKIKKYLIKQGLKK